MIEYYKNKIYPNSVPEFRYLQKTDGIMEMQVRYINSTVGYTSKWMPVNTVQEQSNKVES
jgi:hypothetical protein